MLRSPTATRSRMPVRIGTVTSATDHFVSSVCHRLMVTGIRCRHLGPISLVPYPSAASMLELTRTAPRNPHMSASSEM